MAVSIVLVVAVAAGAVLAVLLGRRGAPGAPRASGAPALRAVFTYVLLLAAVVVSAVGAAGLLGQALDRLGGGDLVGGAAETARNVAFLVVGLPLGLVVGALVRERVRHDPAERGSPAWVAYAGVASLVALAVALTALHDSLVAALGVGPENPRAIGRAVVWTVVWLVHARLDRVLTPRAAQRPHLLAGSALTLAVAAVGVVGLVGNAADLALGLRLDTYTDPHDQLLRALVTAVLGGAAWAAYWWAGAVRGGRGVLDDAYALAVGTLAGTVTAVVAATVALTPVLVWFAGSPATTDAAAHFRLVPHAAAAALLGVAIRWYHTGLLGRPGPTAAAGRTDAHRLRDYGGAVLGLAAGATGTGMLLVAVVEALTRSTAVGGGTATSTVALTGLVLVALGAPLWWLARASGERAAVADPAAEHASPVRRTYLVGLTGVGVLVAVFALVATVYLVLRDLFRGEVSLATLRAVRYALALLLVAGAVAGGHAATAGAERGRRPDDVRRPRFVLLVGADDAALGHAVAAATGARVLTWPHPDGPAPADAGWDVAEVARAVEACPGPEVVVVRGPAGLVAVPVDRAHGHLAAAHGRAVTAEAT